MRGGKSHLEHFRKFIRFGMGSLPLVFVVFQLSLKQFSTKCSSLHFQDHFHPLCGAEKIFMILHKYSHREICKLSMCQFLAVGIMNLVKKGSVGILGIWVQKLCQISSLKIPQNVNFECTGLSTYYVSRQRGSGGDDG